MFGSNSKKDEPLLEEAQSHGGELLKHMAEELGAAKIKATNVKFVVGLITKCITVFQILASSLIAAAVALGIDQTTLAYVGVVNGIVLGIDKKLKLEAKEHGLEKVLAEIGTLQQEVKHASVDEKHGKTVDAAEMDKMKKDFKKFHVDVQALMSF